MTSEAIKTHIGEVTAEAILSLPQQQSLTLDQRRNIIARYTAVLEANFIYWMAATHIKVLSDTAKTITKRNLQEEITQNHPEMLREFAVAANAVPTAADYNAVRLAVKEVRTLVAQLNGLELLVMMAFFENFIAQFMPYLEQLAQARGSNEFEYTDVHGRCDVQHTQELYETIKSEMEFLQKGLQSNGLFLGITKIRNLISAVIKDEPPQF